MSQEMKPTQSQSTVKPTTPPPINSMDSKIENWENVREQIAKEWGRLSPSDIAATQGDRFALKNLLMEESGDAEQIVQQKLQAIIDNSNKSEVTSGADKRLDPSLKKFDNEGGKNDSVESV